jgi:ABC-2 type transport system ATP-binding protein
VPQNEFEIRKLKKSFRSTVAVNGVSLSIEKGSMNFLLGANGSGKSTLIKCMAGHESWDSGEITRAGKSRKFDSKNFNEGLHLISEEVMPPLGSIGELKTVYQSIYPKWNEEIFEKFLAWGGLTTAQNLTAVSRGQKIQGILALTLATEPNVLLVDEATAVLDPFIRSRLMMELDLLQKTIGMTVVIATNIATEVASVKGRLLIMQAGSIVVDRPDEQLSQGFSKIMVAPEQGDKAATSGFSFIEKNREGTLTLIGKSDELSQLNFKYSVDQRAITIDEIFIYYSDRGLQ